jgi:hypothetical protein
VAAFAKSQSCRSALIAARPMIKELRKEPKNDAAVMIHVDSSAMASTMKIALERRDLFMGNLEECIRKIRGRLFATLWAHYFGCRRFWDRSLVGFAHLLSSSSNVSVEAQFCRVGKTAASDAWLGSIFSV